MSFDAFRGRAARLALISALCVAASAAAQARDNNIRPVAHHQANEFYAVVPPQEPVDAPAAHRGCFTTNSSMEATKGIRHWSGRC